MNFRGVTRIAFIIWMLMITVLSVLPYSDDGILSYKLTGSGMVVHFVGYFIAAGLLYWAYRRDSISFILFCGLIIFVFSVILEAVQLWVPDRTFNHVDIAANGLGVVDQRFVRTGRMTEDRDRRSEIGSQRSEDGKRQMSDIGGQRSDMETKRIKSAKDLNVYQKAYSLAMEIFNISKTWPREEKYSLTDQIRRSSRSVCTNPCPVK